MISVLFPCRTSWFLRYVFIVFWCDFYVNLILFLIFIFLFWLIFLGYLLLWSWEGCVFRVWICFSKVLWCFNIWARGMAFSSFRLYLRIILKGYDYFKIYFYRIHFLLISNYSSISTSFVTAFVGPSVNPSTIWVPSWKCFCYW